MLISENIRFSVHRVDTGKTTYLANRIKKSSEVYGPANIMVASFTRAAAAEIASRGIAIPRENVGTLHALCYRALGGWKVAEELLPDWNTRYKKWALSTGVRSMDDPSEMAGATEGDLLMQRLEVLRAKMIPLDLYPDNVLFFRNQWEAWKKEQGCIDFTDMIEIAHRDLEFAPGNPAIGIFDEVQDFTPLELALIRKWAQNMTAVVLAGDDDQCLYSFKGADPAVFFEYNVPEENRMVLSQSYRVPRAVQELAERFIRRAKKRKEKVYLPRAADGEVRRLVGANFKVPEVLLADMDRYLAEGKRVMVLASCSYMLDPLKRLLRERGYPFHNPYRKKRGDWNPLERRGGNGKSTIDRMFAYLLPSIEYTGDTSRPWTIADLKKWAELVAAKDIFIRGRKSLLEIMSEDDLPDDFLSTADLSEYLTEAGLVGAMSMDPRWLLDHAVSARRSALEYPVRVLERYGRAAFERDPQIVLGTIHSVKGGEADVVYVYPDLSMLAMQNYLASQAGVDAVVRQFYVAMTRARESLVLCGPATRMFVKI